MHIYLACFDISDDKNRDRAGKELLTYGDRVQKSVFEIAIRRPEDLEAIRLKLAPLLEDGDDCRSQSFGIRGERLAQFPPAVVV